MPRLYARCRLYEFGVCLRFSALSSARHYLIFSCFYFVIIRNTTSFVILATFWSSDEVSDELLSDLSKRLPLAWKGVGIKLGYTQTQMDSIEVDYPRVEDRTMRMLHRWSLDKGSAATRTELIRALLAADRTGEAEFVCNYS